MLYVFQSVYLANHPEGVLPALWPDEAVYAFYIFLAVAYCIAYWVFDEANYQKNLYRQNERGHAIKRNLFPTFRALGPKPFVIKGKEGTLLADGWWGKARKIHYAADITQSLIWGLSCGFGSFRPYFYCCFFMGMLMHRTLRDEERLAEKYGDVWVKYKAHVPHRFIPGLF